ncbi:MAG: HEAT repeat domain-containing protein [Proteobacteria bacterium]|nr:HEAT repeat domain-containing protein [Pseudomonadota bacterium]
MIRDRKRRFHLTVVAVLGGLMVTAEFGCGEHRPNDDDAQPVGIESVQITIDDHTAMNDMRSHIKSQFGAVEPKVRIVAYETAGQTRDPEFRPDLTRRLDDEHDDGARARIARALAHLGTDHVDARLFALYETADPALRVWYAEALFYLVRGKAQTKVRSWLVEHAFADDMQVSFKGALALARASFPGDKQAIRALTELYDRKDDLEELIDPLAPIVVLTQLARLGDRKARAILYALLDNQHEYYRIAAAEGLAKIGDDRGRDVLLATLDRIDSPYRVSAAAALISLSVYNGHALLAEQLADGDPKVRRQCARGLGDIGARDNFPALIDRSKRDPDKTVRIAAAAAVMFIIGLNPRVLVQASIDWARSALSSQDWAVREAAARTLADLPETHALPLLAEVIVDPVPDVRMSAAKSAARMKTSTAARIVARAVQQETVPDIKEQQIIALAKIGSPVVVDTLEKVSREQGRVGVLAIGSLIAVGQDRAAVRAAAVRLHRAYDNVKPTIRLAVMEAAAIAANAIVVRTLIKGIADRVFDVRLAAAEGLAIYRVFVDRRIAADGPTNPRTKWKFAINVLEEALTRATAIAARAHAALLLFGVTPANGVSIPDMLESPDESIRRAAIPVISAMSWSEANPLLRRALLDRDFSVRRDAVDAIQEFVEQDQEGTIRLYKSLVHDNDMISRVKAKAQLATLLPPPPEDHQAEPAIDPQRALAPVRDALRATQVGREEFDAKLDEFKTLVAQLNVKIAREAADETYIARVNAGNQQLSSVQEAVITAQQQLASLAAEVARLAGALPASVPAPPSLLDEAERLVADSAAAADAVPRQARTIRKKVNKWLEIETADPSLYCRLAETAIAAGKLRQARRNIRIAKKTYKKFNRSGPCVSFTWGLYHDKVALNSNSDRLQIRNLKKAKRAYEKFVNHGQGSRVEQTKERIVEIDQEIADIENN